MKPWVIVLLCISPIKTGGESSTTDEFVKILSKCSVQDELSFDECTRGILNELTPFFKTGVPDFGISPFDPFFAEEVTQRRGGPVVNYTLILRNVYERGWTDSQVTSFKSDLTNGVIRYHQWFPEKYLEGDWEIISNVIAPYRNFGTFNLALYNYTQVTTVRQINKGNHYLGKRYAVRVKALDCGDLKLHISNLAMGRSRLEKILDQIINATWRPGFEVLKPVIDDLVSTAFTKIFNDNFRNFPFESYFS